MRKSLSQIIGEATERLPEQNQVNGDYWSTKVGDGVGGVVNVTFENALWRLGLTLY